MTTAAEGRAIESDENPFVVTPRGFYRRWLMTLDDHDEVRRLVDSLEASTEDKWVPFLSRYRTACLAPNPQFRRLLDDVAPLERPRFELDSVEWRRR